MKVLYVHNLFRGAGGANNAFHATVNAARRHGLLVDVFTRDSGNLPSGLIGRLRSAAQTIHAPEAVAAFEQLLDTFQPEVVHAHELFPMVSPMVLPTCTRRGIRTVLSCFDYRLTCPVLTHSREGRVCTRCLGGREYRAVLHNCRGSYAQSATMALYSLRLRRSRLLPEHVDHYIAPSAFTRHWLIDHAGIPPERITAVPPVVELPAAATDPAAGAYVAYAGRFTREKGMDTLGDAARLAGVPVRASRHAASLVTADAPPGVEVIVTRERTELEAFYRGARLLILPSTWFETFALVGAEAMACGIPVIASRIGAVAELIDDGVDGLLFEPGDAEDLARKIKLLWTDPERCRRMGAAARRKAAALWNEERHVADLRSIYRGGDQRRPIGADEDGPAGDPRPVHATT